MKKMLFIAALLPFAVPAQPLNTTNNPNQPGYVIPSQQRLQSQMQNQQTQQKGMLNQQLQTQTKLQQQQLQSKLNNDRQRVLQSQPGEQTLPDNNGGMLGSGKMLNNPQPVPPNTVNVTVSDSSSHQMLNNQQTLPNTRGGMLSGNSTPDSQQHMLPQTQNSDMLNLSSGQ